MDNHRITWNKKTDPTPEDIAQFVKDYLSSKHYKYLENIAKYYDSENPHISEIVKDKKTRGKTPNNKICTGYYSTLVDSVAGYLGNNIVYVDDESEDIEDAVEETEMPQKKQQGDFSKALNALYKKINGSYIDMQTMIRTICFNKGCEIVYTKGNGIEKADIKVVSVDPRQMLFIYSADIDPEIIYGIRIVKSCDKDMQFDIDFISAKQWASYRIDKNWKISVNPVGKNNTLLWDECPVVEFNTETINCNSAFHQCLSYIDALDVLITGNTNEIDKLADALLKISMSLSDEAKKNMSEWKVIEGIGKEDIAEYITRNTDPAFRKFVMDSLIQEIHKHAHVVDFYSAENGMSGDASGKALKTRLVDMNMMCDRIEKTFQLGWQKRNRLLKSIMIKDNRIPSASENESIKTIFNRTKIVGVEDIAPNLNISTWISDRTKQEICGLDPEEEEKRLEEQKKSNGMDITGLFDASAQIIKPMPAMIKASAPISDTTPMSRYDNVSKGD
jgi:SPP1 family phage portal protein